LSIHRVRGLKAKQILDSQGMFASKNKQKQARGPPIKDRNVVKSTSMLHVQKILVSGDPMIRRGVVLLIVE
jgi:hypothetical protein